MVRDADAFSDNIFGALRMAEASGRATLIHAAPPCGTGSSARKKGHIACDTLPPSTGVL